MSNVIRESRHILSDVNHNNNKFWYIREFGDCSCEVNFGRVGGEGARKKHPFSSQSEASRFFDKKCREKEAKGYRRLQTVDGDNHKPVVIAKDNLTKLATEQIQTNHGEAQNLITYLSKVNVHNILGATTLSYSETTGLFSTPCGIVNRNGITQARTLLCDIGLYVQRRQFTDSTYCRLLNDYLMLVPQKVGRKLDPTTLYPDLTAIRKQNDILDSLEASIQSLATQPVKTSDGTPAPKLFEVKLHIVESGVIIDRLRRLFKSTMQSSHACAHLNVRKAYEIEIDTMSKAFAERGAKMANIWELWHGTKAANLLSIMKGGFQIPPATASHCTGRMYGAGVYTSDQSTKSLNYAYGYWDGKREDKCYMLLNDVAMGRYYVPSGPSSNLPKPGYDSTFAKAGQSGVQNNEMIVPKTFQINPKYLLEFTPGGR